MNKPILKPCPFCGGKAVHKTSVYNKYGSYGYDLGEPNLQWHGVYCRKCKVGQPKRTYFSIEEAYDNWNNRIGGQS